MNKVFIWILLVFMTLYMIPRKDYGAELSPPVIIYDVSPVPYEDLGEFTLTFYTHTGNRTKTGVYPKVKRTIAVDPKVIPLGSVLYVENHGVFIAEDTGGKIKGNRVDIFVNSKQEAINLGVKKAKIYKIIDL